jgi:hypothetical protein
MITKLLNKLSRPYYYRTGSCCNGGMKIVDVRPWWLLALIWLNNHLNPFQIYRFWQARKRLKIGFTKLSFPLVRRVYPNLIANEIVSVQPMTGPTGALFYLDYKFTNKEPEAEARLLDVVGEFNAKVAEAHQTKPVPFKESVVLLDEPFKPNRELMREILANSLKKKDDV